MYVIFSLIFSVFASIFAFGVNELLHSAFVSITLFFCFAWNLHEFPHIPFMGVAKLVSATLLKMRVLRACLHCQHIRSSLIFFLLKKSNSKVCFTHHTPCFNFYILMFPIFKLPACSILDDLVTVVTEIAPEAKTKWFCEFSFW